MNERAVRRFTFKASVPTSEVEDTLALAIVSAEALHGKARVRMDAACDFDPAANERTSVVIGCGSDVGRDICLLFAGFAIREYGEDSFKVSGKEHKMG